MILQLRSSIRRLTIASLVTAYFARLVYRDRQQARGDTRRISYAKISYDVTRCLWTAHVLLLYEWETLLQYTITFKPSKSWLATAACFTFDMNSTEHPVIELEYGY